MFGCSHSQPSRCSLQVRRHMLTPARASCLTCVSLGSIFPPTTAFDLAILTLPLCLLACVAAGGGIGGGAVFVPLFIIIGGGCCAAAAAAHPAYEVLWSSLRPATSLRAITASAPGCHALTLHRHAQASLRDTHSNCCAHMPVLSPAVLCCPVLIRLHCCPGRGAVQHHHPGWCCGQLHSQQHQAPRLQGHTPH